MTIVEPPRLAEATHMSTRKHGVAADLDNRSRLLQAATDGFAEFGYEGASLRTIADDAKVSFQLIAYYFGSKEELWLATVDYLFERYLETGKGLGFTPSGNLQEQFHNHLRILLTDILQRPQLHKICVQEGLAKSPRYFNAIEPKLEHLFTSLALPYFREVVRLGIVEKYTAEETCLLWSALVRMNLLSPDRVAHCMGLPAESPKSVERQVDLLFGILTERLPTEPNGEDRPAAAADPPHEKIPSAARSETVVYPWRDTNIDVDRSRLRQLEAENVQLKQLVGSLALEKKILLERLATSES
jgi:AcrR family transcriptional regulator